MTNPASCLRGPTLDKSAVTSRSRQLHRDFPHGPVVKNLPSDTGDIGSVPDWGTRDLTYRRTTKPVPNYWVHVLQSPCSATREAHTSQQRPRRAKTKKDHFIYPGCYGNQWSRVIVSKKNPKKKIYCIYIIKEYITEYMYHKRIYNCIYVWWIILLYTRK